MQLNFTGYQKPQMMTHLLWRTLYYLYINGRSTLFGRTCNMDAIQSIVKCSPYPYLGSRHLIYPIGPFHVGLPPLGDGPSECPTHLTLSY